MRLLLLSIAFAVVTATGSRAQTPAPADSNRFSCKIQPLKTTYKRGEQITFLVEIWNNTARPQLLAAAVDGSEVGWRCPTVEFNVYQIGPGVAKKPVKQDMYIRCGNTDAMTTEDFVEVQSGQMMNPCAASRYDEMSNWFKFQTLRPGTYEVVFTYSTTPAGNIQWQPSADGITSPVPNAREKAVQALIDRIPAVTLRSNAVTLTVIR